MDIMTSHSDNFTELVVRLRRGDPDAAAILIQLYESELRIIARVRLNDPRLRRVVDSMDICQSILANFFVRASAGQFEIETPEQLQRLLATMIRNKVTDHARRQTADRRDMGRIVRHSPDELPLPATQDTPSQIASVKELAGLVRASLSPEELSIVERRTSGESWEEIAAQLGGNPDALRKRVSRALDRAAKKIGLEE